MDPKSANPPAHSPGIESLPGPTHKDEVPFPVDRLAPSESRGWDLRGPNPALLLLHASLHAVTDACLSNLSLIGHLWELGRNCSVHLIGIDG